MTNIFYDCDTDTGFYSFYLYFIKTIIYCYNIKEKLNLYDEKWKFSGGNGLSDYFNLENIEVINKINNIPCSTNNIVYNHMQSTPNKYYTLNMYKEFIKKVYILNNRVLHVLEKYKFSINLPEKYNSIFIRTGDKLIKESIYYDVSNYINYILSLKSDIKDVFIHSDDHAEVLKCIHFIKDNNIDLNVYYITDETEVGGAVICSVYINKMPKNYKRKPVNHMNKTEIINHTDKMLCAIEIIKNSENCVLDYQSNVSRFIKLYSEKNVFNILNSEPILDIETVCPAHHFIL